MTTNVINKAVFARDSLCIPVSPLILTMFQIYLPNFLESSIYYFGIHYYILR